MVDTLLTGFVYLEAERLGLGERDGRDVSFCDSLLWNSSLVWMLYANKSLS